MITTDDRVQNVGELVRNKTRLFVLHWHNGNHVVRFDTINGKTVKMSTPNNSKSFYVPFEDISRRIEHVRRGSWWWRLFK